MLAAFLVESPRVFLALFEILFVCIVTPPEKHFVALWIIAIQHPILDFPFLLVCLSPYGDQLCQGRPLVTTDAADLVLAGNGDVEPNVIRHPVGVEDAFLNAVGMVHADVDGGADPETPARGSLDDTAGPHLNNIRFNPAVVDFEPAGIVRHQVFGFLRIVLLDEVTHEQAVEVLEWGVDVVFEALAVEDDVNVHRWVDPPSRLVCKCVRAAPLQRSLGRCPLERPLRFL